MIVKGEWNFKCYFWEAIPEGDVMLKPSFSLSSSLHFSKKPWKLQGQQVMLDKDLATLYGVETKVLNQTVKRNIERFPNDFRFELSKEECEGVS